MTPSFEAAELPVDAVEVGRILGAWGVQGWFKILPHSASPQALLSSKRWYLQPSENGTKTFSGTVKLTIRQAKLHSDTVVATAGDVPDRDTAEALRGARIFVSRSNFPSAASDEYYWVDLIGLEVVNREQLVLGKVRELIAPGPQTVLVLDSVQDGKPVERMIPFVAVFIDKVDLSTRRIHVDWQPDY